MFDLCVVAGGRAITLDEALVRLGEPRAFREIGELIETLIAKLDEIAGDPDVEEADPSGDPLDMHGEHPTDDGRELLLGSPVYGIDHTKGPINAFAADCRHSQGIYPPCQAR